MNYSTCRNCGATLTSADDENQACTQCEAKLPIARQMLIKIANAYDNDPASLGIIHMALATLPKLKCDRCGAGHVLTFYPDNSIRSSDHPDCGKPVPGPPNPPRLLDQGKYWIVSTTCVECSARGLQVTQIATAVHKTILCQQCSALNPKD